MRKELTETYVTPQPVFIIGTYDEDGVPDVMNAAWAGQAGPKQITIALSAHRTTENLRKTKEFTVSFGTLKQMAACDYVGLVSLADEPEKLKKAGFTTVKAEKVNAPIVEQLPVALECRVLSMTEEFGETRVVGEVVGMSAEEDVLNDDKVDLDKLRPIIFDAAGPSYRVVSGAEAGAFHIGRELM